MVCLQDQYHSSIHIKLYLRAATVLDVYTVWVLKAFEIFLEAPSGLDRHNSVLSGWNVNLKHTLTVGESLVVAILTTNLNSDARKVGPRRVFTTNGYDTLDNPAITALQSPDHSQGEVCFINCR